MDLIEELVREFGFAYRQLITDSLRWLDEREPEWGLANPIDRREMIRTLVSSKQIHPAG
jgi:hypothetical protein